MHHCYKCGLYKLRDLFYKDLSKNNHLTSKCKKCTIKAALEAKNRTVDN